MPDPRPRIPLPYPHFMAFAPLDVWWRLLTSPRPRMPVRYWLRLAFGLFTSALATALTLPERAVLAVLRPWRRGKSPAVVVILGYYRSGTTHLHYLMSGDPNLCTPVWCQTLAPQGFIFSWAFLRVFMVPFVSARRPQDDVAIGPEWPAEDDFALNNWALASSLPGRFVVPELHAHYGRFHDLTGLSAEELQRWARLQRAFVWKVASWARARRVLLKTPSHTARVKALTDLFDGGVKFIHISRDPAAVIRSNVNMAARLGMYNLQDPPAEAEVRRRVVDEYLRTEHKYLAEAAALAPGTLAEIRYEDLVADPMGQLRRIYTQLNLEWTPTFEARALRYLASVRDYRAANQRDASSTAAAMDAIAGPGTDEAAAIRKLAERFGHDRPAAPKVVPPAGPVERTRGRTAGAMAAGAGLTLALMVLWIAQAYLLRNRHDWLVWPAGVAIGWMVLRTARVGSAKLGLWAALLTATAYALVALPATFLADYAHRSTYAGWSTGDFPWSNWEWYHIKKSARVGALSLGNLFWLFMGIVTAYRFASRAQARAPGRG